MALGQVMLDLEGFALTPEESEILQHPVVGGVILFTRNYDSPDQLTTLVQAIRACQKDMLIAVDQEGGRVQRFRSEFTPLPAAGLLGKHYDTDPTAATALSQMAGWLMATELGAHGLDFSFAPVLDIAQGVSEVIGDRAFHRDPVIVTHLAQAFCQGQRAAGMAAVGKHFPGHGSVREDSHHALPEDRRSLAEIEACDRVPFASLVREALAGIMPAHVVYSQVDSAPAGFSRYWLQTVLRETLGFEGAVFSDDLSMRGAHAVGGITARADHALAAGCDMILICNHRAEAVAVIDSLSHEVNAKAHQRLRKMQSQPRYTRAQLPKCKEWQTAVARLIEFQSWG